jgi:hypothetical protein
MPDASIVQSVRQKYQSLQLSMSERLRRLWAAAEAVSLGRGGITAVALATGLSRTTIWEGMNDLRGSGEDAGGASLPPGRSRRYGGGRKAAVKADPGLLSDLESLVEPTERGDPESPLRWTCKSTRKLAEQLRAKGHLVGERTVSAILHLRGYSLQSNRKTKEGGGHPDRDQQFEYINRRVRDFQRHGQPVISVDTKKKELIGDFKNGGREWRPGGCPEKVLVHDFKDKNLGKAIPYGVYDLTSDQGWASVGIDHDTARFAAETVRRWWKEMGVVAYPDARRLLVTADSGGSNGCRSRLWKVAIQELADEIGLRIAVCHFPPGTSKWNKIEHRMFCHITGNWRGRPLRSLEIVVNLIGNTTTRSGLSIKAELDTATYPTGIEVSDVELAAVQLRAARFHGDWNYTISPRGR